MAKAINTALAPKFEEMTKQLIGSIDGLSDKLGMMNQDALRKMSARYLGKFRLSGFTDTDCFQCPYDSRR